jgi:hypothetical protein
MMNIYEDMDYAERWDAIQGEWHAEDDALQNKTSKLIARFQSEYGQTFCLTALLLSLHDTPSSPLEAAQEGFEHLFQDYVLPHADILPLEDAITLHNCAAMREYHDDWEWRFSPLMPDSPDIKMQDVFWDVLCELAIERAVNQCKSTYLQGK